MSRGITLHRDETLVLLEVHLKNYGREAGIKKEITPYTLRHSFAIHLLENGADLKFISQMLGYSDVAAMQVYADILDSGMREEYKKAHPRA